MERVGTTSPIRLGGKPWDPGWEKKTMYLGLPDSVQPAKVLEKLVFRYSALG